MLREGKMTEGDVFNRAEEFGGVDFNDERLEKWSRRTMETLSKDPQKSIYGSSANRTEAKAIYNLPGLGDIVVILRRPKGLVGQGNILHPRKIKYPYRRSFLRIPVEKPDAIIEKQLIKPDQPVMVVFIPGPAIIKGDKAVFPHCGNDAIP
jgi:hypothetical protein